MSGQGAQRQGALFLFAHGAGASSASEWMQSWARRLADMQLGPVVTFDYPYIAAGRKAPDRLPVLIQAHRAALTQAQQAHGARPVVLIGKSMGARVGCHLAASLHDQGQPPAAVICFGYPLRAAGSGALRDEALLALRTPLLLLQGTRDPLCPLDELNDVIHRMTAATALYVVDGGDHSLRVAVRQLRSAGKTQGDIDAAIAGQIRTFLAALL